MSYSQSIYVDATIGNDTTGDGSQGKPYLTVSKAISVINTTTPIVYLAKGSYTVTNLQSLSLASKTVTVKGVGKDTIVYVSNGSTANYLGNVELMDFIISPVSSYTGDTRDISYSTDVYTVNFRNILFKKNGTYPTTVWFYTDGSGNANKNKNFYNCVFLSTLPPCSSGTISVYNCATEATSFGSVTTNSTSKVSAVFDSNYFLTNADNTIYGVYCGTYSWNSDKFFFYSNGDYYTISGGTVTKLTTVDTTTIPSSGFILSQLTSSILSSQSLKDISPFTIRVFSGVSVFQQNLQFNASKSNSELIILNQNISTKPATTITKYFTEKTLGSNGNIKVVISNDGMATWKTWNGTTWSSLVNTVINKPYASMSIAEKSQWDTFKNEIISVGMTDTVLQSADFSQFVGQNLRFAFVITRPAYSDTSVLKDLQWTYIGKDNYVLLNNSDVKTSINEDYIQLTPTRNIAKVKVNVIT
jgi:hypothetical protein